MSARIEYMGFTTDGLTRDYKIRVREGAGEPNDFIVSIPSATFAVHRARFQDAPDMCFQKVQRELAAAGDAPPSFHLRFTDADFEEYRATHAPKAPVRRHKTPVPEEAS